LPTSKPGCLMHRDFGMTVTSKWCDEFECLVYRPRRFILTYLMPGTKALSPQQ
jgi:hypothetical protein